MKKVVAYCRVSTDKLDQINSYENQKESFKKQLSKDNGYNLIEVFADKGLTGTNFSKREEFNRMLFMAGLDIDKVNNTYVYTANRYRRSKFNYIYVTNTSRFARNIEVISIIRELKKNGVYVIFNDINKSTENPEDEMILNIFFTMDEQESRDKSSKGINGHRRSAINNDKIATNGRLYGYRYIKAENRLEIIEEEAEVVRLIYKLCLDGLGQRKIINELNNRNIKTRNGVNFGVTQINNILRNIKYCGMSDRLKYVAPRLFTTSKIKRNNEENIIYKETDKIPSIISRETYDKAQEVKKERLVLTRDGKVPTYKGDNIYNGKIKCDCCGANYSRNIDRGRVFYNCSKKKAKGVNECNNKNLSDARLNEKIDERLKNFYLYICREFKSIEEIIEIKIKEYEELIKNQNLLSIIYSKNEDIKNLKSKKNRLLDLYLDGGLNKNDFVEKQEGIENEITEIEKQINDLDNGVSENANIKNELVNIKRELERQIKTTKEISKEDFIDIIDKIYVNQEEVIIVTNLENMIQDVKSFLNE